MCAEFLLPQIHKTIVLREIPFIAERTENPAWPADVLQKTVHDLGVWEYHFTFSHGLTSKINSTYNDRTIEFHRYRSVLISETIAQLLGDHLEQASILDIACHCGAFSLDMAHRGAKRALGFDVRAANIRQAEFLKKYYRIDNAAFEQSDVYGYRTAEVFDVVMCLGILYHVVRPIELLELCYNSCRHFAVIDTVCHQEPISAYHVVTGKNTLSKIEGTRSVELQPTYRAVIDSLRAVGFKKIVEVVGTCDVPIELYNDGSRRCFIAYKDVAP
jgi:2-polyprenyl-3-methyl-5-hydroxy-6-metoxy-1,4-benzoquinol methylase